MDTPLLGRDTLALMKYGHGLFNFLVMLFFFYQALLGIRIRKHRIGQQNPPIALIRTHRRQGPVLTILPPLGFCAGITIALLGSGKLLGHPLHLGGGVAVVLLAITTYTLAGRIKGPASGPRTAHFICGLALLFFYLVETVLGLGMLL